MLRNLAAGILAVTFWSGVALAQCEASRDVLGILGRSLLRSETGLTRVERDAKRIAILDEALKRHPHDFFLLRSRMMMEGSSLFLEGGGQAEQLAWIEAMRKKNPDQPVYALLHATALLGKNTPEAIRMFEALKTNRPESAQVHLELVGVYSFGKFKSKEKVEQELSAFVKLCPAPFSASALSIITRNGTPDQIAKTAAALRTRLEAENDPVLRNSWEALWRLEFKARPPAEHDPLRKQIAQDLARFEKSPERSNLEWLLFLQAGYESVGDTAAVDKIKDELLKAYPASNDAKRTLEDRWNKAHPYPRTASDTEKEAWNRFRLPAIEEWLKRWPEDSNLWSDKFRALAALPDTKPEDLAKTAEKLFATYEKDPSWYSSPPTEFSVASAFLKHKVQLDQVPALVEKGYRVAMKREQRDDTNDRYDDEMRSQIDSTVYLKLERARVLLDYYAATKQPEKARELDAELAAIPVTQPGMKSMLLWRRAQAAEVEGRKLDALMQYRAAMETRPRAPMPGTKDELSEKIERLWKELGGTPAAMALLLEKPKVTEATDTRWERPKNPLPAFALADLGGKSWKLVDLQGKAVLANIWATWCGPCRMEHPEFQKLYDTLKDRKDVAVVSINVDDDLGKVAPYMKENSYTFPVLFGREVVDAVVPLLSIPRNWFITPDGKLEWEQIGFGPDPTRQQTMIAKLEELLKPKN